MGIDFLKRSAKSFRKGLDRRRVELCTPDLFTTGVKVAPRLYAATVTSGIRLEEGEKVGVCLRDDRIMAMRGLVPVAFIQNPPPELVAGLVDSFGEACGVVQIVHQISSVAEIQLC